MDVRMYGWMENLTLSPIGAAAPLYPNFNPKIVYKVGQGYRWPYDASWRLVPILFSSPFRMRPRIAIDHCLSICLSVSSLSVCWEDLSKVCSFLSPLKNCLYKIISSTKLSPLQNCDHYKIVTSSKLSPLQNRHLYKIVTSTKLSPLQNRHF